MTESLTLKQVMAAFGSLSPGYVVSVKNAADKGKTLVAVALVFDLVNYHGYKPEEVYSNLVLEMPGYNYVQDHEVRDVLRDMARKPLRHKIVLIDEVNSVFPSRFFKDKQQTEDLLGLWQATKLGNWVIFTHHMGTSIDKIIRSSTQIELIPEYDRVRDILYVYEINGIDLVIEQWYIENASEIFPLYWRWQPIGVNLRE